MTQEAAALPDPTGNTPGAAIFFARDFLAVEFSGLADQLADRPRVYIVMNEAEASSIRARDPAGEIWTIGHAPVGTMAIDDGGAVSRDRTLRFLSLEEIATVRRSVADVCEAILRTHPQPSFYFDEPVSGYANEVFNRRFSAAGALCLHFQSCWIPGYLFFVHDVAQGDPIALNVVTDGREVVERHIAQRAAGKGLPHYLLSYGSVINRTRDAATASLKAGYRWLFRRGGSYIDRDTEAHRFHAQSLRASLAASYASPEWIDANVDLSKCLVYPLHYEPESMLTHFCSYYRQEDIAARLLDSLPPDWTLILKEHPSQPGALHLPKWRDLIRAQRVMPLRGDYPGRHLFAKRPIVMSLGSTFALESAFSGCVTGVLGDVHFAEAPGVTKLDRPEDWVRLRDAKPGAPGEFADWYGKFVDRYCFEGNLMRGKTWFKDFPRVIAALDQERNAR